MNPLEGSLLFQGLLLKISNIPFIGDTYTCAFKNITWRGQTFQLPKPVEEDVRPTK